MKHIDDHIRDVFSEKLGNYEVPVSPELWNAVQAKITSTVGGSAAAGSKIAIWIKAGIASLIVVGITATTIVLQNNDEKSSSAKPTSNPKQLDEKGSAPESLLEVNEKTTNDYPSSSTTESASASLLKLEMDNSSQVTAESNDARTAVESKTEAQESGLRQENSIETPWTNSIPEVDLMTTRKDERITESKDIDDRADYHLNASFEVKKEKSDRLEILFIPEFLQAANYYWDFGDGSHSKEITPSHVYDQEGEYQVQLTISDKNQRVQESGQNISVYLPGAVIVPNVFTPNGDGVNDVFDPLTLSKSVEFERVIIFDSKGRSIFESKGGYLWDGKDSGGNTCEPGQYQYILVAHDRNHQIIEKKGYVTLIR